MHPYLRRDLTASLLIAAILAAGPCFGSGYEFEGIGAREVSRAGAAIADSSDWSAVYWNPANLTVAVDDRRANAGLELFGGQAHAKDSNSLSALPFGAAFSKDHLSSNFLLGAVGAAVKAGERGAVGLGFYTPLLQGVNFSDDAAAIPGLHLDYKGAVGILTWALEGAVRLGDKVSVGGGLDVLYGRLSLDSTVTNFPFAGNDAASHMKGDGVGLEGIAGLRWQPSRRLSLGAVFRTGSDITLKGDANVANTNPFVPGESSRFRYQLRHPPTGGIGLSYRATDRWTVNTDVTQTWWKRFSNAIDYEKSGVFLNDTPNTFHWRDAWKLRLGTGYRLTDATELLGGYSYDRPALDPGSVDLSTTIDVPMNRVYLGGAHRWTPSWETILGGVYGSGRRTEEGVRYRLSGWQAMLESQWRL